jgi:hypothetical protein
MQSKARKLADISKERAVEDVRDCETESKRLMGEISGDEIHNYCSIINVTGVITKRKMKEAHRVAIVADITNSHKILVSKFQRKKQFRDPDRKTVLSIV